MKDRVFIVWSGTSAVATKVKNILEKEHNYVCSIGGNSDNNSTYSSVGDTVIQQIKSCNQAIVIFQNKPDGGVSNNLFFELGFVLAMYGQKKIHCVKMENDKVILPSDFDNSFVEPIPCGDSDEEVFSDGIVKYFMSRQKMSINENKMFLINNRYLIDEKIHAHYSEMGSRCSDYELAQYLLFYMQAAHMFGDVKKIQQEILEFKQKHNFEFSSELALSVNLSLTYFDILTNIKVNDNNDTYIDQMIFWNAKKQYTQYLRTLEKDEIGIFDEWARVYITQQYAFSLLLFANNNELDNQSREMFYKESIKFNDEALSAIEELERCAPCRENNDSVGLLSLFKAYIYRNNFLAKKFTGDADVNDWLELTLRERENLKNNFGKGTVDTQLYLNFCMEYYLSLVNYLSFKNEDEVNKFDVMMYKSEIKEFIVSLKEDNDKNVFLNQIDSWCNN